MIDKCNNVFLLFGIFISYEVKCIMVGNVLLKIGFLEKEKKCLFNRLMNKCGMYDKLLRVINIFFLLGYYDNYCKGYFFNIFVICLFFFLYNYFVD